MSGVSGIGGVMGILAVAVGLVVCMGGLIVAVQRGPRGRAFAITVLAALPLLMSNIGVALGQAAAQSQIIKLGPAVTPKDMAQGQQTALMASLFGSVGTIFALVGAAAALARSRPESPLPPPPAE